MNFPKKKSRKKSFLAKNGISMERYEEELEIKALNLVDQGKPLEAEELLRISLSNGVLHHRIFGILGVICSINGNNQDFLLFNKKAIEINSNYLEGHVNLGLFYKNSGEISSSIYHLKQADKISPNNSYINNLLGLAYLANHDTDEAFKTLQSSIRHNPDDSEAHNNLGIIYQLQGKLDQSIESYRKAIELNPEYAEAQNNLGIALQERGDFKDSIDCLSRAIELKPNYSDALNNIANAYMILSDITSADTYFKRLLFIDQSKPQFYLNHGNCLLEQCDFAGAIFSFKMALELDDTYAEARLNLGMAQLLLGNYSEGWENFESRLESTNKNQITHAKPACPIWDGKLLQKGENLLVVSEQGFGDTFQFVRYLKILREKQLNVSLCTLEAIHPLIQASGIDEAPLTPEQGNKFTGGYWIPLMSVPRFCNVNPKNPLVTNPYLNPTKEMVLKWKEILSSEKKPIIGLNWAGRPQNELTNNRGRSISLDAFYPLFELNQGSFLSLQKGFAIKQLENFKYTDRFVRCQSQINKSFDWSETAGIIANCDLVISSDSSVAHLAAAMGKETWLLLKFVPEWRWATEGDQTFWYPSMRVFRQKSRNNWNQVLDNVANELERYFNGKT